MGRSPQGSLSGAKKINNLRVDESIGLFAALVGDQKSQRISLDLVAERYTEIELMFSPVLW